MKMIDRGDVGNLQFNTNVKRWSNVHIRKPSKYVNKRYETLICTTMVTRNERKAHQN